MMKTFNKARKILLFSALSLMAAILISSCASKDELHDDGLLTGIVQDSCADTEKSVGEVEFSEDIDIKIKKQDAEGGNNDDTADTSETADPDEREADLTDEQSEITDGDELDGSELDFEGSVSDLDFEDDYEDIEIGGTDEMLFNPDYMSIDSLSKAFKLYDVPLTEFKQKYVIDMAQRFKIPPELIFGVMYVESRYDETAISKNGKYIGIMQIAKSNLKTLKKKFGTEDLQDFLQNVEAGAYFLSYFYKKYDGNIDKVCMCYHCGEGGASVQWRNGVTQDGYCRKVRKEMERIYAAETAK